MVDESSHADRGGMAALQVAEAHQSTLLTAVDALDSKASLLVAVNVALFGVFFGALISATSPTDWIALTAPAILFGLGLLIGGLTLRPRRLTQFPAPASVLRHRTGEFDNDQLAWSYVRSIRNTCVDINQVIDEKVAGLASLAVLTICQLVAIAISAAIWIP